jgi:hypothetical protein
VDTNNTKGNDIVDVATAVNEKAITRVGVASPEVPFTTKDELVIKATGTSTSFDEPRLPVPSPSPPYYGGTCEAIETEPFPAFDDVAVPGVDEHEPLTWTEKAPIKEFTPQSDVNINEKQPSVEIADASIEMPVIDTTEPKLSVDHALQPSVAKSTGSTALSNAETMDIPSSLLTAASVNVILCSRNWTRTPDSFFASTT